MKENLNLGKFYSNIEGFPGYHITKDGKVYSCKKITKDGWVLNQNQWRLKSMKFKPKLGYIVVKLSNGKIRKSFKVHRLVAMAYIPNPNPDLYNFVCHKDNNRTNNNVDNLYWGNQRINMDQMVQDGNSLLGKSRPDFSGDLHPMNKAKSSTFWFIYELSDKGYSLGKIADRYSVKFNIEIKKGTVRRILRLRNI